MKTDARYSSRLLKQLLVLLFIAALPLQAHAQDYPNKPMRIVVPYPPGGASDVVARLIGQYMGETFRQPVIIENRAGANGIIAYQFAAQSAPDGYTMLMSNVGPSAINPSIYTKISYDAIKDFTAVSLTSLVPLMLVVNASLGVNSVAELLAKARAAPGILTYGTGGTGTAGHLAMELFMSNAGIRMERVSYKGDGLALNDMLGNQITAMFTTVVSGDQHVQSGKLKALAVTTTKRLAAKPDLPTVAELGMPGFEAVSWGGVVVPVNTPRAIVTRLNVEINRILKLPDFMDRLAKVGAEAAGGTPEEFQAYIVAETEKWGKVANAANIKLE
ncbi:MAG: tripartite tricarboxylate transporter substrate binding protein [Betaproteobacteria bacterium]